MDFGASDPFNLCMVNGHSSDIEFIIYGIIGKLSIFYLNKIVSIILSQFFCRKSKVNFVTIVFEGKYLAN